jgi:hypothetical protein
MTKGTISFDETNGSFSQTGLGIGRFTGNNPERTH